MNVKRDDDGPTKDVNLTPVYLVRVTSLIRQVHLVVAHSPDEAEKLAPEAEIVGDVELMDIVDAAIVDRVR